MKNTLIVILLVVVIVLGYLLLRPKPTNAPMIPAQSEQTQPSSSNQVTVAGMQKYTDTSFGFSFWYPSDWKITTTNTNPTFGASIKDASVIKRLWLTRAGDSSPSIVIQEAHSTTRTITDTGGAGPIGPITYYFDPNKSLWMTSSAENGETTPLVPANISDNTMGGLHIFRGTSRFGTSIIPLSADNFVIIGDNGGSAITSELTNTLVALDPSVATPVSVAQQIQTIQGESRKNNGS